MDEFITTTGSGAVSTEPDAMRVPVAVEALAPTVAEALATVAEAAGRAVEVARWQHRSPGSRSPPGFASRPSGAVRAQVLLGYEVLKGRDGASIPLAGASYRRDRDVALVADSRANCGDEQQQRTKKGGDTPPPPTLMRWSGALNQCRLIAHGPHRNPAMPVRR
jgi:Protein of unknown function (DUF541)